MGRFTRTGVAMGLATALATSVACSGGDGTARSDSDTLRIAGPFEVHSLEPAASDGFFTRLQVVETLVSSDMRGELTPGLAMSWSDSRGMRSWTFELPEDVRFHDGTPVTPDAVAASLEIAAGEAASPLADAPVKRIVPVDSGVRFDLSEPYPTLPAVLTHYSTAALAPASYDDDGHVTEIIGSGPYEIDRVELPASIEVSRFDKWRGEQPAIEKISFQAVGRAESRALMAVSDQADVVFGLEPAGRQRVAATDGVAMASSLQPRTLLLKVNNDHPILGDVRVREALSLALDRAGMAEAVLRESELAATQLMPPSLSTWHEDGLDPLEHDPDAAHDLLAEAGWQPGEGGTLQKNGTPLRLTLTTYPDRPELPALATAIQASLREIGVEVAVDVTNSSEIPAGHQDGSLELGLFARHFALVADPLVTVAETFAPEGEDWGVMNWRDAGVTKAVDGLLQSPADDEAQEYRTRIVETAQRELPLIPVAWYRMNAAVSDRVAGFELDPLERTWRVADMSWAEQGGTS